MRFRLLEVSRDGASKEARKKQAARISRRNKMSNSNIPPDHQKEVIVSILSAINLKNSEWFKVIDKSDPNSDSEIISAIYNILKTFIGDTPNRADKRNIEVVSYLSFLPPHTIPKATENINAMFNMLGKGSSIKLKPLQYIIGNGSLYNRSIFDMEYTIRVFDILSDSSKFSKYFPGQNIRDVYNLMFLDDPSTPQQYSTGRIKPAGASAKSKSKGTIYGTLEALKKGESTSSASSDDTSAKQSYPSFERAWRAGVPSAGKVIHIEGDFKYDPQFNSKDAEHWRPLKL